MTSPFPHRLFDGRYFNIAVARKRSDCSSCGHAKTEITAVLIQFADAPEQQITGPAAELVSHMWDDVKSRFRSTEGPR